MVNVNAGFGKAVISNHPNYYIDVGNLLPVAEVFKKKYSNKNFIIAYDNDYLSPKNTVI